MTNPRAPAAASTVAARPSPQGRARRLLEQGDPLVALGCVWLVMLLVQGATDAVIGNDGYYHIKMAWLMRHYGPRFEFPWLPLTILKPETFTNHHFLYHLLLVPFTFGDLRSGAKLAGLTFGLLAILSTYFVMIRLRVRYPLLWLVALLASAEWFLTRQSMTRRQSVSLAALMLATWLLASGRHRWLLPLAFAYGWLFDGYVILVAVAGIAFASHLVARRELRWSALGWPLLGLALSQLIHPYFPHNLRFTLLHLAPKIFPVPEAAVGSEWSPYPLEVLLITSWLALALFVAGLIPLALSPRRALADHTLLFLAGTALMFVCLYLRSRRFVETEPAFATLFCAYAWTHHRPTSGWLASGARLPRSARAPLILVAALLLAGQTWWTVERARLHAATSRSATTLAAAARWLAENTEPGERVYHSDWDDFPELFFHNTHNTYIVGLDPTYMYLEDPARYAVWRAMGRGEVPRPSAPIRQLLGARWAITDRQHASFLEQTSGDPDLELVFETPSAVVFRVRS